MLAEQCLIYWPTAPEVRLFDFSLPDTLPFPFREMGKSFQSFSGLESVTNAKNLPGILPGKPTSPSGKLPGFGVFETSYVFSTFP